MTLQSEGSVGTAMHREMHQSPAVFVQAATQPVAGNPLLTNTRNIYTIARGSSDAVATILAYEYMDTLQLPVTSLPPSVFSLRSGLRLDNTTALVISQSGASEDLQRSVHGVQTSGGNVIALTNQLTSLVATTATRTLDICAGDEIAVPATKSVIGSIAAGMALLASANDSYTEQVAKSVTAFENLTCIKNLEGAEHLIHSLQHAGSVYIVGRGAGYGASQEVALKFKETCALHAEAYSASEVMHGPLQLVDNSFVVLMLDTEVPAFSGSLDKAQQRFTTAGASVHRIRISDVSSHALPPAASAAMLLYSMYPVIHQLTLLKGLNPDAPAALTKVTNTV